MTAAWPPFNAGYKRSCEGGLLQALNLQRFAHQKIELFSLDRDLRTLHTLANNVAGVDQVAACWNGGDSRSKIQGVRGGVGE